MSKSSDQATLAAVSEERVALVAAASSSVAAITAGRHRLSGIVWRPGLVVTADEALPDHGEIHVTLHGKEAVVATVAGRDASTDIALLRIESKEGAPARFASSAPQPAATVLALGATPDGPMVAQGIVAHAGPAWRSMRGGDIDARIELDMRLPRSAEGGPVIDVRGNALGMAVFGPRRRVLVIPGATIERIAARLEKDGRVGRGYLGLGLRTIRLDGGGWGLLVANTDSGGPGENAGIRQGDIVTHFDGHEVHSPRAVTRSLGADSVGSDVALTVRRGGEDRDLTITIGERPAA